MLEEAASAASRQEEGATAGDLQQPSEFDNLQPGRRLSSPLPYDSAKAGQDAGAARFSATILDVAGAVADAALQSCCVFLVPQVSRVCCTFTHGLPSLSENGGW
jgi:hypothetical protein